MSLEADAEEVQWLRGGFPERRAQAGDVAGGGRGGGSGAQAAGQEPADAAAALARALTEASCKLLQGPLGVALWVESGDGDEGSSCVRSNPTAQTCRRMMETWRSAAAVVWLPFNRPAGGFKALLWQRVMGYGQDKMDAGAVLCMLGLFGPFGPVMSCQECIGVPHHRFAAYPALTACCVLRAVYIGCVAGCVH